jgi:hypothetical protein
VATRGNTACGYLGPRRDLLETVTHVPRGDIVSVYTSFPWPALCAEIAKLKIDLREGELWSYRRLRCTRAITPPLQALKERAGVGNFL